MTVKRAESVARMIKQHRIRLNYTQQHLSDISGISLRSLQRIEKGNVIPRASTLHLLSKHLDIQLPVENIDEAATDNVKSGKSLKLVLSVLTAIILVCLALAFVFQSPTFPESAFELCLFIAGVLGVYGIVLVMVWKRG